MLMGFGLGWAVLLLILGATMVTHEYDFRKTIFTCISTLLGMAFALFWDCSLLPSPSRSSSSSGSCSLKRFTALSWKQRGLKAYAL